MQYGCSTLPVSSGLVGAVRSHEGSVGSGNEIDAFQLSLEMHLEIFHVFISLQSLSKQADFIRLRAILNLYSKEAWGEGKNISQ